MKELDAYVAIKSCGHAVAVCSTDFGARRGAAKSVAAWIRKGLEVVRWSDDKVRANFLPRCSCMLPADAPEREIM